jgi:hypothetical protein
MRLFHLSGIGCEAIFRLVVLIGHQHRDCRAFHHLEQSHLALICSIANFGIALMAEAQAPLLYDIDFIDFEDSFTNTFS